MTGGLRRGLLVVVSGPSGVGKGTVIRRVRERLPDALLSVSVTTRAPRPDEREGVDYHFVSDDRFDELVASDALLEWAPYAGNRYGTPHDWVHDRIAEGAVVLLEIEVQGAVQIRRRVADALLVFLVPPSFDELERRLVGRGTEPDDVRRQRLAVARSELERRSAFDRIVVNADLATCVDEVVAVIEEARARSPSA